MKTKIFVYSGTGNSYASAKQMAYELKCECDKECECSVELNHITHELGESRSDIICDVCVVVFPVYAYAPPKTVRRFLQSCNFDVGYMAVVGTIGSATGGALAECVRVLKRNSQQVHYTAKIKCVENFVHMFKLPPEEEIPLICEKQKQKTSEICDDIKQRKTNKRLLVRPESVMVSCLFKGFAPSFAKRYKVLPECDGCEICYRVCPAQAIDMDENTKKPKFTQKLCDHCQACMQLCPKRAIKFGKVTPEGRRYCHPDVKLKELFKR